MLKDRRTAVLKVAESLYAAENAIDVALARAAELTGAMVSARTEANLSAIVAQDAFEGSAAAVATLTRARGELVETHKRLTEAKIQVGLRTLAVGDMGKPPSAELDEGRHLRSVA
ncbi:MAG: hypothetical protein JO276_05680 [Sphingomonadaceae bacterium]|nr:hypothetical protein [Sphingomonadaceae bacterium]